MIPSATASGLPKKAPANPRPSGALALGTVVAVDHDAQVVAVHMDDGSLHRHVQVGSLDEGPDRGTEGLPGLRARVLVAFPSAGVPVVLCALKRPSLRLKPSKEAKAQKGAWRRVWRSGAHVAAYDDGAFEVGLPDGTFLAFGPEAEPRASYKGQKREKEQGNPDSTPELVDQATPSGFKVTLRTPDGCELAIADGKVKVKAPAGVEFEAPSFLFKGGAFSVDASQVNIKGSVATTVEGGLATTIKSSGITQLQGFLVTAQGVPIPS